MDFDIRELLMFIGALIFIGVLVDGIRRFQQNRNRQIKVKVDKKIQDVDDESIDWYVGELPNGPARVKNLEDAEHEAYLQQGKKEQVKKVAPKFTEPVDILMEGSESSSYTKQAPRINSENIVNEMSAGEVIDELKTEKPINEDQQSKSIEKSAVQISKISSESAPEIFAEIANKESIKTKDKEELSSEKHTAKIDQGDLFFEEVEGTTKTSRLEVEENSDLPEEVLAVNVIAKNGEELDGSILLEAAKSYGLRFGDMDIFHRHENSNGQGPIIFSMASAINPGTFDIEELPHSSLKGVTFFMRLSQLNKRTFVLELMVDIAKRLANQLGAELKDDTHSVLSSQTITHYKSRIQEYERRYLGQVLRK
jgi:cell division protein ZipA